MLPHAESSTKATARKRLPLQISVKLGLCFGVLVLLALFITISSIGRGRQAIDNMAVTADVRTPAVIASGQARSSLLRMLKGVRGYLSESDLSNMDEYNQAKAAFVDQLHTLRRLAERGVSSAERDEWAELERSFNEWVAIADDLLELHNRAEDNRPAFHLMNTQAQPLHRALMQGLDDFLDRLADMPPSALSAAGGTSIAVTALRIRVSFDAILVNARAFSVTGDLGFRYAYTTNLRENSAAWRALAQGVAQTPRRAGFAELDRDRSALLQVMSDVIRQAGQADAQRDLYWFRTKAIPKANAMLDLLDSMIARHQELLQQNLQIGRESLVRAQAQNLVFGGAALVLGVILVMTIRASIVNPIRRLTRVVEQIQDGDWNAQAVDDSRDEIGIFARAFNTMTGQLRDAMHHLEHSNAQLNQEVSERKRAESALQEAKEHAETANRAKSAFLASMSHELRTPLNSISGFTQRLLRDPDMSSAAKKRLYIIERSSDHLLNLINQVLDLSKIEAEKMTITRASCHLHDLLDDLAAMFRERATEKSLQFVLDVHDDVPHFVQIDELKLRQILINLLSNAIKFTVEGGVRVQVTVEGNGERGDLSDGGDSGDSGGSRRRPHEIRLHFQIRDSGPGISAEELAGIFDAFTQSGAGRQSRQGTGLGLYISRKFVELMGGTICINSELGSGTEVRFWITAPICAPPAAREAVAKSRVRGLAPGQTSRRILLVDDIDENRQLLREIVEPLGFELREAQNGTEAITIYKSWRPDLIWMDIRMPDMDGYTAAKRIRDAAGAHEPVIIALTASSVPHPKLDVGGGTRASHSGGKAHHGCDDFLRKPYRESEIFELMAKHLGLEYVYERIPSAAEPSSSLLDAAQQVPLSRESFAAIAPQARQRLLAAIASIDVDAMEAVVADLRGPHPQEAQAISALLDRFDYEVLAALLA